LSKSCERQADQAGGEKQNGTHGVPLGHEASFRAG
jgi:hypothetical protein